ncbi:hypothetical protein AB0467_28350 [Streptomyces sp. NPDC052095]|uniref:hypothetical protein n=1 Tax=unclassified Streptomyces TaxID=2593676 RepID=UPI003450FA34
MSRLAACATVVVSAVVLSAGPVAVADPSPGRHGDAAQHHTPAKPVSESARLARSVLGAKGISYATAHVEHTDKSSLPRQNLVDVSNGALARTSPWGHKKGARVALDARMLNGVLKLSTQSHYRFEISELVGGRHGSGTSKHYAGRAVDVTWINGRHVGRKADHRGFMNACRKFGATLVLGPGDKGHDTHVHCQW